MTSPPAALYFSAESSPAAPSPVPSDYASNLESRDIHIAAEALESLRALSVPPATSSSFILPPIQTQTGPNHLRPNKHHKISTNYKSRHSPYHSRSSSFSESSPGPASPSLPSIEAAISQPSSRYPNFLNPLVSSAVRVYENSKSFSPRFKVSAEKLESVISSRMTTSSTESPDNKPAQDTTLPPITAAAGPRPQANNLSKWLVTATSLATTLSFENRQRLRYCLHLLKLANTHIATKVSQLQELLQEETAAQQSPQRKKRDSKSLFTQTVNNIKKDIIWTIRKVVSALSTYAGNSLPEPARSHVRTYILRMPQRWVSSLDAEEKARSRTATPTVPDSPQLRHHKRTFSGESVGTDDGSLMSPTLTNSSIGTSLDGNTTYNTEAGNRVLSLANEALDMLGSIINIVDETLERANVWCSNGTSQAPAATTNNQPASATGTEAASNGNMRQRSYSSQDVDMANA